MKTVMLMLIRFYQRNISPLRPPCCRFTPTCSAYAVQAITKYGALKGGWLPYAGCCDAIRSTKGIITIPFLNL